MSSIQHRPIFSIKLVQSENASQRVIILYIRPQE